MITVSVSGRGSRKHLTLPGIKDCFSDDVPLRGVWIAN